MARYRKIDSRIWGDYKYRQLSKPQPNAQSLWIFLLTGPLTTIIPGAITAGPATMAEILGWPLKSFHKALQEILDQEMVIADFEDRLVWIPNAIKYNHPASPNVVRAWIEAWDEIPECDLKTTMYHSLKTFMEGKGEAFVEAFVETCKEPFGKTLPNQEQEQDTKQEQEPTQEQDTKQEQEPTKEQELSPYHRPRGNSRPSSNPQLAAQFDLFWEEYPRKVAKKKAQKIFYRLKPSDDLVKLMIIKIKEFIKTEQWQQEQGKFIPYPSTWLNQERWNEVVPVREVSSKRGSKKRYNAEDGGEDYNLQRERVTDG